MPRPKTVSDSAVLDAALRVMLERGPEAVTFAAVAKACDLSPATLVQRFGTKALLLQRTALHAWDGLETRTAEVAATVPRTPEGAIAFLTELSLLYDGVETYADGLRLLREDLRDPVLRARGAAWHADLRRTVDECFSSSAWAPHQIGSLVTAQWQGALAWWAFSPTMPIRDWVADHLHRFVTALLAAPRRDTPSKE